MKPILVYKPQDYTYKEMLLQFQEGKPLSCDQLNFLYRYEYQLSHSALDEVCRYYLKQYKQHQLLPTEKSAKIALHPTLKFALPTSQWNKANVNSFKEMLLQTFKKGDVTQLEMVLTPEAFNKLRTLTFDQMVYLHGYRLNMHESFFPGWFPYSVYFQWANVFGVARYDLLPDQKLTKTQVTLYLEPQNNRPLEKCVQDYLIKNHLAFKPAMMPQLKEQQEERHENEQRNQFTPQLTLSRNKEKKEDDKI